MGGFQIAIVSKKIRIHVRIAAMMRMVVMKRENLQLPKVGEHLKSFILVCLPLDRNKICRN